MVSPHDQDLSLALFIDFENLVLGVKDAGERLDMKLIMERLVEKGTLLVKRAYADWSRFSDYKQALHGAAVELIEVPQRRLGGKNSADIRMVVDAMDLSFNKPHIGAFVVASGDSDFSPLVSKLRENNKQVIGVGVRNSTSELLVANCDEFIFYEDLMRERASKAGTRKSLPKRLKGVSARKCEGFLLLLDALAALERQNKEIYWSSLIKESIKRKTPSFDESYYGYKSFSRLLEAAQDLKLVKLRRDEKSGGYVVEAVAGDVS